MSDKPLVVKSTGHYSMGGEIGVVVHGLTERPYTIHDVSVRNCDFETKEKMDLVDCENVKIY